MSTFKVTDLTDVRVAVIGGSGLYHLDNLTYLGDVNPETPWGFPSAPIHVCETAAKQKVAFLSRHGKGHVFLPHELPFRANIAALKAIGCQVILAFSACGSLREEIAPEDFILVSQLIDRTKGIRPSTFFGDGMAAHVMFADPFSPVLSSIIADENKKQGIVKLHENKCLVCMEGPAFSTRAESHLYRSWGCDVINMTAIPEAKLAKEAEIEYQMINMATDYDCWRESEEAVSVEAVIRHLTNNASSAKKLAEALIPRIESELANPDSALSKKVKADAGSSKGAVITAPDQRNKETAGKLNFMLHGYF
uniref:S-methyl-5'-thioadenosine phosphorylase n=1 Tax=Chromera velia CCMP2878 TaxID=1169474 RepID=A0A0G4HQ44_9ALVE|mmetsp:Transcript_8002/g.15616  ORF Transcript_8002/g.15616 Transcript_8002/m.15616 type:complete len:308 (-) Transcript_8002:415-1338(-)|eukprot:Cvel_30041.t1-p1 / transcript=Cvel_30041.t1 / gene=Cvel_30041 / organism=Chromera_velia_CCMP2878 / gene_product=S-methyl-5'-thioadenosine phosphorylase, putative / transcript_product=S-methyl-5'-thioadenosine phosphorylase, putative / location=Cvel_scaffold4223:3615-4535(+) / protein_length=307 / sequence_SO=supercontig / SO=protein_coding / is_pseudo=false